MDKNSGSNSILRRWWLGILFGTILIALVYFIYEELGSGKYQGSNLKMDPTKMDPTDDELKPYLVAGPKRDVGKQIFLSKCMPCHGAQGQGGIGPNLTDDYWIHGGKPSQIFKIVRDGVLDRGMPPWGAQLSEAELYGVVGFVKSLGGTNPPGAKAPQGVLENR